MDPKDFRWPAPAKINLMLHILGRRDDGYHLLETHFQFINWLDWLSFEPSQAPAVTRAMEIPGVPVETDLTIRAAELLRESAGITETVCIDLEKSIPMGAGLGGGSSNAATVLVALNEIWRAGLSVDELAEIGLSLGADVPVFIRGEAAFATGIGENLTPLDAPEGAILMIYPACHVETKAVFTHSQLTRDTPSIKIPDLVSTPTNNDCESVTRLLYPEVADALDWLGQYTDARMSGTGASVFAVFETPAQAENVARLVPERWTSRVTTRINRSPLMAARSKYIEING
jgi:4-diphosphocytidyl-2-C-methyl-D-erythritol kinase